MSNRTRSRPTLQLRLDEDLADALEDFVARQPDSASRSEVARTLLRHALQMPEAAGVVAESIKAVHRVSQEALNRLMIDVRKRLPQYLKEAADEA